MNTSHESKTVDELERMYGPLCLSEKVLDFMLRQQQPYWTRINYRGKTYIMTFQYHVYQVTK